LVSQFSEFSVIFYAIYKNQPTHFSYWRCAFAVRPRKRTVPSQCGPWARLAGAGCSIPAITGGGTGRGRAGKGLWVAMDRFGRSVGGEMSPVGGAPAARGYRPPWLAKPAMRTSGGGLRWPASYWGARGDVGKALGGAGVSRGGCPAASGQAALRAVSRSPLRRGNPAAPSHHCGAGQRL
jgi:hypothetical protein